MYVAVAMPARTDFDVANGELVPVPAIPQVMGPFSTLVRATKAAEACWSGDNSVRWIVLPVWGYKDSMDQQVSLVYDRLVDPSLRQRCPACKQKITRQVEEDVA